MFQSNEWWFGAQLHHTAQIVMHWRIKGYDPLPLFLSTTISFFLIKKRVESIFGGVETY
jgi:hypothetical protein